MGSFRHSLGTFLGLGTGLVNFCVVASRFISMVCYPKFDNLRCSVPVFQDSVPESLHYI